MKIQTSVQITMKTIPRLFGALCASLFCIHQAHAADLATNESGVQLTVELRDGSHVVGKSVEGALSFHSGALGDMKLAWAGIRSIEFSGTNTYTARLTATNGDAFAVTFAADALRVETGFGQNEFPVKLIRRVKVSTSSMGTAGGAAALQLMIELRDGSQVVGKGLDDSLSFHSPAMGDLKLTWSGIRSLQYTGTNTGIAQLTATNGDVYEVRFDAAAVRVETSFGKTELPVNLIRGIKVSAVTMPGELPSGLVSLWAGEGNANDGIGGNKGQLVNGAGFMPGKVGQAFNLNNGDGGDGGFQSSRGSYVRIPSSPSLDVGKGDGFAIECWIKPVSMASQQVVVEFERKLGTASGSDVGTQLGMNGGCLAGNIKDVADGDHIFTSPANLLVAGAWQHIALTYDKPSGLAAFYINGTVVTQTNIGSFTPQTSFIYLLIGARTTFGSVSNPRSVFSGGMDEIGIYNRALSSSEVQAIYDAQNNGESLSSSSALPLLSSPIEPETRFPNSDYSDF